MREFLVDTNILSAVRKGAKGNPNVFAWYTSVNPTNLYLSVITLGELSRGINMMRKDDPAQANLLNSWYCDNLILFKDRILWVDLPIMDAWAKFSIRRTIPVFDSLLAATALVNNLVVATRNVRDFLDTGVEVFNPFEAPPLFIP